LNAEIAEYAEKSIPEWLSAISAISAFNVTCFPKGD